MASIKGVIRRINYYNPKNGYTVSLMELNKDTRDETQIQVVAKKTKLFGNTIVVVGVFDHQVAPEEEYILNGVYINDPNYGLQFKFETFSRVGENTIDGVVSYFASSLFPSIGIKTAKQIVEVLGINAADIIAKDRTVLDGIGISKKNADIIYEVIKDNEQNQKIIIHFLNLGISMDFCHRIAHELGPDAIDIVNDNPYILMEKIERFGFKKNDALVIRMGIPLNSPIRLEAVIKYVLLDSIYQNGNSYIDIEELFQSVQKYLGSVNITKELFASVIKTLIIKKKVAVDKEKHVFDFELLNSEKQLAKEIVRILKNDNKQIETFQDELIKKEYDLLTSTDIEYNDLQKKAILTAFTEPMMIITGGPGTGKTTIVKAIIKIFTSIKGGTNAIEDIALLAPTGRAAKRLKEITSIDAKTIHKFLGYMGDGYFEKGPNNKTIERLIIVDEASMMDLPLASRLFSSTNENARFIIVGDVDQLPSVGPGQVLKDLIDSKEIRTIKLTKIHRQAENSQIIHLAHDINEGMISENILTRYQDREFIESNESILIKDITNKINDLICEGYNLCNDIQVLAPMYRHSVGINAINEELQKAFNPITEFGEYQFMGKPFRINDRVIQLVNRHDKQIMNGDVGQICSYIYQNGEINGVNVKYDFGTVSYQGDEMEDLSLAYVISIHKSQGSEFPIVIMPFVMQYNYMLKRKLIYTAITRAKIKLIIIGEINTLINAIKQIERNRRTILVNEIKNYIAKKVIDLPFDDKQNELLKEESNDSLGEESFDNLTPYDFLK